eukprot:sb/3475126/
MARAHCTLPNKTSVCTLPNYFLNRHQPTETSKQLIGTRYLGHVTGYQPIRDQYFLISSRTTHHHHQTTWHATCVASLKQRAAHFREDRIPDNCARGVSNQPNHFRIISGESGNTGPWLADNQSRNLNNEF